MTEVFSSHSLSLNPWSHAICIPHTDLIEFSNMAKKMLLLMWIFEYMKFLSIRHHQTNFGINNNRIAKTQIQLQISLYELFYIKRYETDKDAVSTTSSIQIGPIILTWRTLMVSAMGSLIIMPPLLIMWVVNTLNLSGITDHWSSNRPDIFGSRLYMYLRWQWE